MIVYPPAPWILWEVASQQLKEVGYKVEKETTRLAVRRGIGLTTSFPDYLYLRNGRVSEKSVKRLLKRMK